MMFDGEGMDNGMGGDDATMPPAVPSEGGDTSGDDNSSSDEGTGDESTGGGM